MTAPFRYFLPIPPPSNPNALYSKGVSKRRKFSRSFKILYKGITNWKVWNTHICKINDVCLAKKMLRIRNEQNQIKTGFLGDQD